MSAAASLSSVSSALGELTARVTAIAEQLSGTTRDDQAAALYEVERSLTAATRRLDQVVGALG